MCALCPQLLQDELAERSVQLEKVKRAGRDLVSTEESPSLKAVDILCAAGEKLSYPVLIHSCKNAIIEPSHNLESTLVLEK